MFDVNDRGAGNTQSGWTGVNLNNINGVSFTGLGGVVLDDRDRGSANTDGGGDVANNDMWRDFIFADERDVTLSSPAGVDIDVSGLSASTMYNVRLWAFDELSNGGRNMTWNGNALGIPSSPDPASLMEQMVSFQAMTDGSGVLTLEGRIGTPIGVCCNVFVNGFEVSAVPEPSILALFGTGIFALGFVARRKVRSV